MTSDVPGGSGGTDSSGAVVPVVGVARVMGGGDTVRPRWVPRVHRPGPIFREIHRFSVFFIDFPRNKA